MPRDDLGDLEKQSAGRQILFNNLVDSKAGKNSRALLYSVIAHVVIIGLLVLVPIMWPGDATPPTQTGVKVFYDPPPPPPLPLPLGSSTVKKTTSQKAIKPRVDPENKRSVLDEPRKQTEPEVSKTEEKAGSETGSADGVPEGMEGGVTGGQIGGVPGGVIGGVIGGTGDTLGDYDQGPQLIRRTKPIYPSEAAVRRVEGQVEVELIVGTDGHARDIRVVSSIPILDAAAIQCVSQWVFLPAIKNGKPVAALVHATITFRLL